MQYKKLLLVLSALFLFADISLVQSSESTCVKKLEIFNTDKHEYSPMIVADSKSGGWIFYLISTKVIPTKPVKARNGEVFYSVSPANNLSLTAKGHWSELNIADWSRREHPTFMNYIKSGISIAGKEAIVSAERNPILNEKVRSDSCLAFDLFRLGYHNNKFSNPLVLEVLNTKKYEEMHPALSPDGNTLYFVSNRNGGPGGYDIYFSRKTPKGWTPPQLVPIINSPGDEVTPFIGDDGVLLYSSNWNYISNERGKNGFDIYRATLIAEGIPQEFKSFGSYLSQLPDCVQKCTEINSPADEIFPYLLPGGKQLMFSSNKEGVYNLYTATLPHPNIYLKVNVLERFSDTENNLTYTILNGAANIQLLGSNKTEITISSKDLAVLDNNTEYKIHQNTALNNCAATQMNHPMSYYLNVTSSALCDTFIVRDFSVDYKLKSQKFRLTEDNFIKGYWCPLTDKTIEIYSYRAMSGYFERSQFVDREFNDVDKIEQSDKHIGMIADSLVALIHQNMTCLQSGVYGLRININGFTKIPDNIGGVYPDSTVVVGNALISSKTVLRQGELFDIMLAKLRAKYTEIVLIQMLSQKTTLAHSLLSTGALIFESDGYVASDVFDPDDLNEDNARIDIICDFAPMSFIKSSRRDEKGEIIISPLAAAAKEFSMPNLATVSALEENRNCRKIFTGYFYDNEEDAIQVKDIIKQQCGDVLTVQKYKRGSNEYFILNNKCYDNENFFSTTKSTDDEPKIKKLDYSDKTKDKRNIDDKENLIAQELPDDIEENDQKDSLDIKAEANRKLIVEQEKIRTEQLRLQSEAEREAAQARKIAEVEAEAARHEAEKARLKAEEEAKAARHEAEKARLKAEEEAKAARHEAEKVRLKAAEEAKAAREKAEREAAQARKIAEEEAKVARHEAEKARLKAEEEAKAAREKAEREAAQARKIAEVEAEAARHEAEEARLKAEEEAKQEQKKPNISEKQSSINQSESKADSESKNKYTVSLGAYSREANARSLYDLMQSKNVPEMRISTVSRKGRIYYRVRSGLFPDKKSAEDRYKLCRKLLRQANIKASLMIMEEE